MTRWSLASGATDARQKCIGGQIRSPFVCGSANREPFLTSHLLFVSSSRPDAHPCGEIPGSQAWFMVAAGCVCHPPSSRVPPHESEIGVSGATSAPAIAGLSSRVVYARSGVSSACTKGIESDDLILVIWSRESPRSVRAVSVIPDLLGVQACRVRGLL